MPVYRGSTYGKYVGKITGSPRSLIASEQRLEGGTIRDGSPRIEAGDDNESEAIRALQTQTAYPADEAAARSEAHGLKVVMNRCPAIEIPRLRLPEQKPVIVCGLR